MTDYYDDDIIPDWVEGADQAYAAGYGIPTPDGLRFDPYATVTRGQDITTLSKFGLLDAAARLDAIEQHIADLDQFDDNVIMALSQIHDRIEAHLGLDPDPNPPVPPVEPPQPPTPPPTGDGNVALWLPAGFEAKVELPRGHVGAMMGARVIDPPGNIGNGRLENVVIRIPEDYDQKWVVRNGICINVSVHNPHGVAVGNFFKNCVTVRCVAEGVTGDMWKAGGTDDDPDDDSFDGEYAEAADCVAVMQAKAGSNKHYDGMQIFKDGRGKIERCLVDWRDAGTVGHTTGALFTQDRGAIYARDVTVINPGGTNELFEFHGSGDHNVDRLHVWGERRENWQGFGLWPDRLLSGNHDVPLLFNDVPGATDG